MAYPNSRQSKSGNVNLSQDGNCGLHLPESCGNSRPVHATQPKGCSVWSFAAVAQW
jgi:hypothetical protein